VERIGRPVVIGVLVALLGTAVALAYLRPWDDRIPLGDKGRVSAVVEDGCMSARIQHDGYVLQNAGEVPRRWKGRTIEGDLVIDAHRGDDAESGVNGTFTADDGASIAVYGGRGYFFTLGCAIW
jgi:hypothetical protein